MQNISKIFLILVLSLFFSSCKKDCNSMACKDKIESADAKTAHVNLSNKNPKDSVLPCCVPNDTVDLKTQKILDKIQNHQN